MSKKYFVNMMELHKLLMPDNYSIHQVSHILGNIGYVIIIGSPKLRRYTDWIPALLQKELLQPHLLGK